MAHATNNCAKSCNPTADTHRLTTTASLSDASMEHNGRFASVLNQFDQTRITFFSHKSGQFQIRLWDKTSGHAFATTCIAELHHLVLLVEGVRSHRRLKHHGMLRFCIHGWNRSLFRAWVPEATSHTLLRLNPAEHLISPISPQISSSLSNLFLQALTHPQHRSEKFSWLAEATFRCKQFDDPVGPRRWIWVVHRNSNT